MQQCKPDCNDEITSELRIDKSTNSQHPRMNRLYKVASTPRSSHSFDSGNMITSGTHARGHCCGCGGEGFLRKSMRYLIRGRVISYALCPRSALIETRKDSESQATSVKNSRTHYPNSQDSTLPRGLSLLFPRRFLFINSCAVTHIVMMHPANTDCVMRPLNHGVECQDLALRLRFVGLAYNFSRKAALEGSPSGSPTKAAEYVGGRLQLGARGRVFLQKPSTTNCKEAVMTPHLDGLILELSTTWIR